MSFQYPDVYSDLLCGEDAGILSGEEPEKSPAYPADDDRFQYAGDVEDLMAELVVEQRDFIPGFDYAGRFRSRSLDAAAREEAIAWIFKVHAYYHFQPITAYLSVNYMDRFLATHRLPQANGWPLQLLSVATLSLAAKMEETFVPSLLDLQVEGARFVFEPRTIGRMELLVLNALNWRLRSITPFNFIEFFAYKVDPSGGLFRVLVSRASQIILASIQEIDFLDYWPSCVAAAAMLCAADAFSDLPLMNSGSAVSWCVGLSKEKILSCYRRMQQIVVDNKSRRKPPKILPQLRVTTPAEIRVSLQDSSPSKKRRKLSNFSWADDVGDDEDDENVYGNDKERL